MLKAVFPARLARCVIFLAVTTLTSAALQPGPAQSSSTNGLFTLENDSLAISWVATNANLLTSVFVNKLATQSWTQAGSELFRLAYSTRNSGGATSSNSLAASTCALISGPQLLASQPSTRSPRLGDQLPGRELVASFFDPVSGIQVDWRAVLRDGANYVRQFLTIRSTNSNAQLNTVELLDYATASTPTSVGSVTGSPVVAGQVFLGGETPFAAGTLTNNRVRLSVSTALPLGPSITYDFSSVVGVFPSGQLRRSFLYYLERERAAPYRQLLHFNSWLDVIQNVSEGEMLTAINTCELELHQRRGVALDSYVMDDGWDDPSLGFWAIDTNKFPNQFNLLQSNVTAVGSHLGLWIAPLGGYNGKEQRIQDAINMGIITNQLDLSIPTYYNWWTNRCATFLLGNAMNYLKWDAAVDGVTPHSIALLRAADALRSVSSNVFVNITTGTWPSPFWLLSADSIWRGGSDSDLAGVGDAREQWITYRDGQTWQNTVQAAPLYPVTSLMLCGIIHANYGGVISQAGTDLRHEARTFFGSGVNLQELYLTPSMLTSDSWNHIAEAARWARTNANVLADSHWVGGNPNYLQAYGWASWIPSKGILVLRNPSSLTNSISVDIGKAFELPSDAAIAYNLSPTYADQRPTVTRLQAGQAAFITLLPFEVLVFDVLPTQDTAQAPKISLPLPPPVRYYGGTVILQAAVQGSLPIYLQWKFNGVPIPFATNATLILSNLSSSAAGDYSVTASNVVGTASSTIIPLTLRAASAFAAAVLTNRPVAWWRMGDNSGPVIADAWSTHNGIPFGNIGFGTPGAFATDSDTAIRFDASSGTKIDVPYAPELNPTNFSFSLWVRPTGGAGTYRSPLTSRDDFPPRGYLCYAAGNNNWEFWTGTGSSWHILTGPSVVFGQWTHLVGTFDGTNKSFYVNGQLVGAAQSTTEPNTNRPLRIGAGSTENSGAFLFVGDIDEVAVYDHALASNEVAAAYFVGAPPRIVSMTPITAGGPVYQGATVSPAVAANGQIPLSYRWSLNGTNLTDNGRISGSQSNRLTIAGAAAGDAGTYQLMVTNAIGTATTNFSLAIISSGRLPVPVGAMAWWPGESNTQEIVGGNTGTWVGGTSYGSGIVGTSFSFGGSGQAVMVPYSSAFDVGEMSGWTFETWIKPASFNSQPRPTVFSKGRWNVSLGLNSGSGRLESWINNTNQLIGTVAVPLGQWSHVALVCDGTTRTFYVNGLFAGAGGAPAINPDKSDLAIGGVAPVDVQSSFSGAIDEVTLYSRALLAAEIQSVYLAGAAGKYEQPVLLFEPQIRTVTLGANLVLTPVVAGTGPVAVQWLFNGNTMTGATNATLTVSNFQPAYAGSYQLVASNAYGSITSSVAPLTAVFLPSVGDGISDLWRARFFGGNGTIANGQSCSTCDADGTGQNNLFKYVAGLDPTNPASVFRLSITSVSNQPAQKILRMSPIAASRTYTVEFSTNLLSGGWLPLTAYTGPLTNNGSQLVLTDTNAVQRQEFYRVRIFYTQPSGDSVGDGIPDWWRQLYYGADGRSTNSQSCATCDPSGGAQNNLFKYLAGLNPYDPVSRFAVDLSRVSNQPTWQSLTFNPMVAGRAYSPQFSTSLARGIWLPLRTYAGPLIQGTKVIITDTNAVETQKYYRIRLSLP